MADDMIGYEHLMQDALRSVVRAALQEAASPRGLPGKHHFYITFRTHGAGVIIPETLRARYPDEMTIVLEHQFWDLEVYADRFRVILKFSGQPHPITIPLKAITRFFDPSVKFGLQFQTAEGDGSAISPVMAERTGEMFHEDVEDSEAAAGAEILSFDAFRKK